MKKIVIDARESGTSTGRYIDKLVEYLHKLKPQFQIIILAKGHRLLFMKQIAPNFEIIESPFQEFTFAEQLGFKSQLDKLQADLVHFPMVQQPARYRGNVVTTLQDLTTVRFRNPSKNPIIFMLKQQVYKWLVKRVARSSAHIITPTEFVKQDVVNYTHIRPGKITVTNEAADKISDEPTAVNTLARKQFIMYVGRPLPHKNLWRLIEAFQELKQSQPELVLALAGKKDPLYEAIENKVIAAGIQDVVFTGFVSEGELRWMYENTAAYIFPSLSEGFGLPGLEAMVHGAPVVSSNATCLPEVYGDAAQYFDPLDVHDIAANIAAVLSDKNVRDKLIQKGKAQAAKYSWRRMAEQTLAVYESTLRSK